MTPGGETMPRRGSPPDPDLGGTLERTRAPPAFTDLQRRRSGVRRVFGRCDCLL